MFKTIIIAAFLFISLNSAYSKSHFINFTSADSLTIEKQNSTVPEKFDIYSERQSINPPWNIYIDVPEKSNVSVQLYNYDDKLIGLLFEQEFEPGTYKFVPFKSALFESLPNSVYYLQMKSVNFSKEKKIYYVK